MFNAQTDLHDSSGAGGSPHAPRRTLPAIAICWIAGLGAGAISADMNPGWWLFVVPFACAIASLAFVRRAWSMVFVYLALFASGMLVMNMAMGRHDPDRIRELLQPGGQFAIITGLIDTQPALVASDRADRTMASFILHVQAVKNGDKTDVARGSLQVHVTGLTESAASKLEQGALIRIRGAYRPDHRGLLESRGRDGVMRVASTQLEVLEENAGNMLVMWCLKARDRAARVLGWGLPEGDSSVTMTRALLLGLRSDIDRKVNDAFARTGTLHILSLSGTHIGILVLIMVILLKSAGVSRPSWVLFFLPVLTLYTIGTGGMASTVRAAVMAIVYFLAYFLRRRPDAASSLAFSALLILSYDPLQLFDLGFILSFVIVAGLIGLYRPVMSLMPSWSRRNPDPVDQTGFIQKHAGPLSRKVFESFSISVAAWLVSLPLVANLFHLISPVALLINLILIPLTFVILLTACLSVATGIVSFHLASIFNHANWLFCEWLITLIDYSAGWLGSHFYVRSWSWPMVAIWYVLLLVFMVGKRAMRWTTLIMMLALAIISITDRWRSDHVEISVIPGGSAASLLVDGPGGRAVLLDTGSRYRSRGMIDYVRSRGINRLDEIWITRATADAYGGLTELLASVDASVVRIPDVGSSQPSFSKMIRHLADEGYSFNAWPNDRHIEVDDLVLRILHPDPGHRYENAGLSALVMQISHETRAIMFAGESNARLKRVLVEQMIDYTGSCLILGRLTGPDSLADAWLDRIRCQKIVLPPGIFDDAAVGAGTFLDRLHERGGLEVIQLDEREPYRFEL